MKYRNITSAYLLIILSIISLSFSSCSKENQTNKSLVSENAYVINYLPARTSNELQQLRANKNANLIRSIAQFDKIVLLNPSLFSKLSNSEIKEFRDNLIERENIGIVGLGYGVLKKHLSYEDYSTILAMFGLDIKSGYWGLSNNPKIIAELTNDEDNSDVLSVRGSVLMQPFEDHSGYYCSPTQPHNCIKQADHICLSGC